jgi:hypothetical protein
VGTTQIHEVHQKNEKIRNKSMMVSVKYVPFEVLQEGKLFSHKTKTVHLYA